MAASAGFFDDFGDALQQEALGEMADSFFGARRLIEDELEQLHATLHELNALAARAIDRLALLHALLVDETTARRFYAGLDLAPGNVFVLLKDATPRLGFPLPAGLRWSARYLRLLELAYTFAFDACNTYLHGKQRVDPTSGARGLSLHYHQIQQWCEAMNRRIAHINASQPPSLVMAYARALQGGEQGHAFGCTLGGIARSVDSSLGLPLLSCEGIGVGPLPALPSPVTAGDFLRSFARETYGNHVSELRQRMRSLEADREKAMKSLNNLGNRLQ